ncbi:hypothetical protein FRC0290_00617 [Corynebacterium diphtheriae]|uniref:hypothetical protein n=1 Tax=Corynebacterium TaxID=1716 RepID=UPI000D74806B|nr:MULTISPECIES: hypothetical protein [Corynebacterium]AWR15427.1 hypothetical protein B11Q_00722 [Corynebacterium diphtheriae]MBC6761128.1 hypothetical protein [Corynebacterium sp. LK27]CAB0807375.1 hypothetical protein FRC0290_00617 [Corynebacterium diphtheriae]CAB1004622.1 hypothetical protein FRC0534_00648 [Corynebacterium diphtheriae]
MERHQREYLRTQQQRADVKALQQADRQLRRVIAQRYRTLDRQNAAESRLRDRQARLNRQVVRELPGRELVRHAVSAQILDSDLDRTIVADEMSQRGFYDSAREMGQRQQRPEHTESRSTVWESEALSHSVGSGVGMLAAEEITAMVDEVDQIVEENSVSGQTVEQLDHDVAVAEEWASPADVSDSFAFAEQAFPGGLQAALAEEALSDSSVAGAEESAEAIDVQEDVAEA